MFRPIFVGRNEHLYAHAVVRAQFKLCWVINIRDENKLHLTDIFI